MYTPSPMDQPPPIPPAARTIGRYALHREIATGGMATVFVGRALGAIGFSRTVAIKRLHPHFARDPEFVSMFCDEARLAARIHHPNVVPTLDVVAIGGELFLVMDYVQGESLFKLLRALRHRGEKLPTRITVAILTGVLSGLHAAHEATNELGEPLEIVHRDVSPQNILVGTDGVARVLDFGVAKAAGRVQETHGSMMKGKLPYMSPEHLRGTSIDRRTDIFAASAVLWEMLTGRRLFDGTNDGQIVTQVLQTEYPSPRSIVPTIPPAFESIVMRGLSMDPENRWKTAAEMSMALERAAPPATPREVGEFVSRAANESLQERSRIVTEMESLSTGRPDLSSHDTSAMDTGLPSPQGPAAQLDPSSVSRRYQSSSVSHPSVGDLSSASSQPVTARSLGLVIAASLVASLLVVVGLLLVIVVPARMRDAAPAPTPAASASPPTASDLTPSPNALSVPSSPSASPAACASAPAAEQTPPVVTAPTAARTATKPPATQNPGAKAPAPKANCNPPYTVDAKGVRIYKPECL